MASDVISEAQCTLPSGSACYCVCIVSEKTLASGHTDSTVRMWDVHTGATRRTFTGHTDKVLSVCMVSVGVLASGSADKTVRLWDVRTGATTRTLAAHSDWVRSVCVVSVGVLASGSADKTVRLWDVRTGATTLTLTGHADRVLSVCMVSVGVLASGSADKTVRLWDVHTGDTVRTLTGHSSWVRSLCMVSASVLASAANDKTVRLWDVRTGDTTRTLLGHSDAVYSLYMASVGTLASGARDKTVRLWDVRTGATMRTLTGHTDAVYGLCMVSTSVLASGSADNTVRLWNPRTGADPEALLGAALPEVTRTFPLPAHVAGYVSGSAQAEAARLIEARASHEGPKLGARRHADLRTVGGTQYVEFIKPADSTAHGSCVWVCANLRLGRAFVVGPRFREGLYSKAKIAALLGAPCTDERPISGLGSYGTVLVCEHGAMVYTHDHMDITLSVDRRIDQVRKLEASTVAAKQAKEEASRLREQLSAAESAIKVAHEDARRDALRVVQADAEAKRYQECAEACEKRAKTAEVKVRELSGQLAQLSGQLRAAQEEARARELAEDKATRTRDQLANRAWFAAERQRSLADEQAGRDGARAAQAEAEVKRHSARAEAAEAENKRLSDRVAAVGAEVSTERRKAAALAAELAKSQTDLTALRERLARDALSKAQAEEEASRLREQLSAAESANKVAHDDARREAWRVVQADAEAKRQVTLMAVAEAEAKRHQERAAAMEGEVGAERARTVAAEERAAALQAQLAAVSGAGAGARSPSGPPQPDASLVQIMEMMKTLQAQVSHLTASAAPGSIASVRSNAAASQVHALQQQIRTLEAQQRRAAARLELKSGEFTMEEEDVREGGFGTVSKAVYQGQVVALKRPKALQGESVSEEVLAQLRQEVDALDGVAHAHVLRLLAVCTARDAMDTNGKRIGLGIVMPWMDKSLKERVEANPAPSWTQRMQWLRQVAMGMSALHSAGMVHRDLKAANVMIDTHEQAQVADLGLAGMHGAGDGDDEAPSTPSMGGTVPWMAPELFLGEEATPSSDAYSFAMLMYEVANRGEQPWADAAIRAVPRLVQGGKRPSLEEARCPLEDYEALYDRCCSPDVAQRPSFAEIAEALTVMRAKVSEVTTVSTRTQVQSAPWHAPDALRDQLPPSAVTAVRGRNAVLTASSGQAGFELLLNHVKSVIAPRGNARVAEVLSARGVVSVSLVCNATNEMAFYSACQQLDRRYAAIDDPGNAFHPKWHLPEFVRSGNTMKQSPEQVAWRRAVMERLHATVPNWAEGRLGRARVVLAFHACSNPASAQRILDTGFAALSKMDPGFFGQGLYLTPDLDYAVDVYGKGTHGTVLACAVVLGNPYPVTEHPHQAAARADTLAGGSPSLLGGANVPGYDAHVAVVQRYSKSVFYPYPPEQWAASTRGPAFLELVVFERAHILPLAVMSVQRR